MLYECAEFSQNGYIPGMAKRNVFTQTASSLSVHLIYVKDVFLGDHFIFRHFPKSSCQYSEETSLGHSSHLSLLG